MGVRVLKLQIMKMDRDARNRWMKHSDEAKQVVNCIWQTWLVWHVQNRSADKIRKYLDSLAKWRDAPKEDRGKKPKLDFFAIPKECDKKIYDTLAKQFPDLHTTSRELIRNNVNQKIKNRKAAKGVLSGWMAILLFNESIPSTTRGNPIPFSKRNAKIEPPEKSDGNFKLHINLTRIPIEGKKNCPSVCDSFELMSRGRKVSGQIANLKRICTGEYKFCGSSVVFRDKKWFALICYQTGDREAEMLNPDKVAFLRAAKSWPWKLRLPDRNRRPGGNGPHVASVRRQVLSQRWSRQANYRFAGSANKGHGRNRALNPLWGLSQRWKDFVKTYNHTVTADIVRQLVDAGIGTLVYYQPDGPVKESRFLTRSGKMEGREDATGWDWFQVKTQLEYKCKDAGIELITRKSCEKKQDNDKCNKRLRKAG